MKRYHVTTFGCQMNAHDSERIKGMLEELGLGEATAQVGGLTALPEALENGLTMLKERAGRHGIALGLETAHPDAARPEAARPEPTSSAAPMTAQRP